MRLAVQLLSITYLLVMAYLILTHGKPAVNLVDSLFKGYTGSVKVLQGR